MVDDLSTSEDAFVWRTTVVVVVVVVRRRLLVPGRRLPCPIGALEVMKMIGLTTAFLKRMKRPILAGLADAEIGVADAEVGVAYVEVGEVDAENGVVDAGIRLVFAGFRRREGI